jgi:hypothetical protein
MAARLLRRFATMQIVGLVVVCLLGGWALYSSLLGGAENAKRAVAENAGRGFVGIAVMAIVVFIGLVILGALFGG